MNVLTTLTASISEPVAPDVHHQTFHALLLHIDHCIAEFLTTTFRVTRQIDISDTIGLQSVIRYGRILYGPPCDLHLHLLIRGRTKDLQHKRRAGIATQVVAHIIGCALRHVLPVNGQDDVAFLQPGLSGRHAFERLINDDTVQQEVLPDGRPDTGILTRQHHLQLLL